MRAVAEIDTGRDLADRWIARHQAGVWRYLRFLGCSRELAFDLTQETFLAALGAEFVIHRPTAQSTAWLRTTARNLYRMHLRAERARPSRREVELDEVWQTIAADDGGDGYHAALRECLGRLDGRARRAIVLRYRDGLSREAIAEQLGLRPEGAKTLLRRVREALHACIERRRRDS